MAKNSPFLIEIGSGLSIMVGSPKIATWNTATRPKIAKRGIFGFNSQTNSLEYYDGSSWFAASMEA